ncbi:MAG: hypothetical protein JSS97_04050 [Actinobacteria bacterium]|nr:hypothetical protein [Actinomycetota bacterium]
METINFLPVVKAYPTVSKKYGEVSCIAGIEFTEPDPVSRPEVRWIRLYPVPFRDLEDAKQFAKYQPMRIAVKKHSGDKRPETRRPNLESIELTKEAAIPAAGDWSGRRRFVEPLMTDSMCGIQRCRKDDKFSLGIFRPAEIVGLDIEAADVSKDKEEMVKTWARLRAQSSLLDGVGLEEQKQQMRALDLIPWRFKLRYRCDDPLCEGKHAQSMIDWEIGAFYLRIQHEPDWDNILRAKVLEQMCGPGRDVAIIVGNQLLHPTSFLVLGLWYPERRAEQLGLGDVGDIELHA